MIEDKKLGLKIVENPTEDLWNRNRDATKSRIEGLEQTLIVEKAFLIMCERKVLESKGKPKTPSIPAGVG